MLACSKSGVIEQRIGKRVDNCQPNVPCIIRIKDLTDFQWDQMYVFSYGANQELIERAIKTPFPAYVEFKRQIIFLKDGKIVHWENEPKDIEGTVNGQVSFPGLNIEPSYKSFTPDDAVFRGEKREGKGGRFYVLTKNE
jgi:hypothetical protein